MNVVGLAAALGDFEVVISDVHDPVIAAQCVSLRGQRRDQNEEQYLLHAAHDGSR
jgi:hypothetical protein